MSLDDYEFDQHGFLIDARRWNEQLAAQIAARLNITGLTAQHLAILHALRRHYAHSRAIPPSMHVCRELEQADDCIDRLFGGPANAWKSAGLPDPGEEARVYLDNQTPDA